MLKLALTGSIGMGKSETARMFAELGIPVFDADATVHRLYAPGGDAVAAVEAAFPGTVVDGQVDRARLGERVLSDSDAIARLEAIVHPLVRREEQTFLKQASAAGADIILLDIPLLFETSGESRADRIVVVSAPADVQRERVLARPGMAEQKFEAILAKQVPDAEKRARADYVIETNRGLDDARNQVKRLVDELRAELSGPGGGA